MQCAVDWSDQETNVIHSVTLAQQFTPGLEKDRQKWTAQTRHKRMT